MMKGAFIWFGAANFIWAMLPSWWTAPWFGVTRDTMFLSDDLTIIIAVMCFGFAAILHKMEKPQ